MSTNSAKKLLGIACPSGSAFYTCGDKPKRFLGCCSIEACATEDGSCPRDKLAYTSFNKTAYDLIPPQACEDKKDAATAWYTCASARPPFMGCCAANPCQARGCAAGALRGAVLSADRKEAAIFLAKPFTSRLPGEPAAAPTPGPPRTRTRGSAASSSVATSASASASGAGGGAETGAEAGISKGAVVGMAVGITVGVLIAVVALFLLLRRRAARRKRAHDHAAASAQHYPALPEMSLSQSPSTGARLSPSSACSVNAMSPAPYGLLRPHLDAAQAAELPATAGGKHGAGRGLGLSEMDASAKTGFASSADQHEPAELEDPTTYDGGGHR